MRLPRLFDGGKQHGIRRRPDAAQGGERGLLRGALQFPPIAFGKSSKAVRAVPVLVIPATQFGARRQILQPDRLRQ